MTRCCSYPFPHRHYDEWIRETVIRVACRPADGSACGKHIRELTVDTLLRAWKAGRAA